MSTGNCIITGGDFRISEMELEYCRSNGIPLPTICPRERLRAITTFRNRVYLYNSTCALTQKKILSCFPPERGWKAVDVDVWHSDSWDAKSYGRPYDFERSFFDQFIELYKEVPLPALAVVRPSMENSEYTNGITGAKNCYLLFSGSWNEDCMFSYALWRSRNIVDCVYLYDSELCYESADLRNCYNVRYSQHCHNCTDSLFLSNCYGCKRCFGCVNLSQAEYCFYNEKLSKSDYERRLQEIDLGSIAVINELKQRLSAFASQFPVKYFIGRNNESSSGDYISNNKNCQNCYFVTNSEDAVDSLFLDKAKNSIVHAMFGNGSELIYNSVTAGDNDYNLKFCVESWQGSHNLEYCIGCCYGTGHCFGCVSIRKGSYCILNKQYSKEDYFETVARIKTQMLQRGEYGQFFPASFSPFYYNHSNAQEFFPASEELAIARGFDWKQEEPIESPPVRAVPGHAKELSDDLLNKTFRCRTTGKPFRFIKQELDFYREHNIPPPDVSPMERIRERLGFFAIEPLVHSSCAKCAKGIETMPRPGGRAVYCEQCFQADVF